MIEKPAVPDAVILKALEDCFAIRATELAFVPRGLDPAAWSYRARAGDRDYFVKVSQGQPDEVGAWLPMYLGEQGMAEVIAPVRTVQGEALGRVANLTLRVQPYVPGESAMDAGMTEACWKQLGAFLSRLHALELPEHVRRGIRHETFAARRLEWVNEMQQRVESPMGGDRLSAEWISFWRDQGTRIGSLIDRTIVLRQAARAESRPRVLCHGDIHTGNLLLSEDGRMHVVDWDDAILAPRERDLMFVLAEVPASDEAHFFAAYGSVEINPVTLAYYRHDWCIEDIGAFGQEILDAEAGEATRTEALRWFKTLFAAGGSVPTALGDVSVAVKALHPPRIPEGPG